MACRRRLIARKGREVTHHFAHRDTFDCDGGWEGLTHSQAKQLIAEVRSLFVPLHDVALHDYTSRALRRPVMQKVEFERVNTEVSLGNYRIDLEGIHASGKRLVIEIAVTSACSRRKRQFLRRQQEPAVEIYLNQLSKGFTLDEFKEQVLKTAPRIWIYNSLFEQTRSQERRRRRALRSDLEERAEQYESAFQDLQQRVRDLATHSGDRLFTGILQLRNLKEFDIPFRTLCVFSESGLLAEF
ncbi:MAG TPA: hypothetical protein VKA68_03425 [bacterium]|nr:hypothetical protein [bacterium]